MKIIVLALILAVTSAMAQSAPTTAPAPEKPKVTHVKKAILQDAVLRDDAGKPAKFRTVDATCPVVNGYPTFWCCAIGPGASGCYCYFMWDLPKGCY
jgi:hypothetical protein